MSRVASTTVGLLVGGAVGAITALMLAPKRGEELRSDVWNWTRDMEHKAADGIRTAGTSIASGVRHVPGYVSEHAPEMASKVVGVFSRGNSSAQQAAEQIEQQSHQMAGRIDQHAEQM